MAKNNLMARQLLPSLHRIHRMAGADLICTGGEDE
jgi:hypothetical protein